MVEDFKPTCLSPVIYRYDEVGNPSIMYPCGKCILCLERKRRQWALRMEMETKYAKSAFFVTLTYNDENVPYLNDVQSLRKKDYQSFLKNLRKRLPYPIRFFGVGEYGLRSQRPHYHLILWLPDFIRRDKLSNIIGNVWRKGFVQVDEATDGRMYYIAKYCCKLSSEPYGVEKGFQTCSQNPPIGYRFFENNLRLLDSDFDVNYIQGPSFRKSSIPRSFERKYKKRLSDTPRSVITDPAQSRSIRLRKIAGKRLRQYVKDFNDYGPDNFNSDRDEIERRYFEKLKHKKQI